jgi:hypothetical protein
MPRAKVRGLLEMEVVMLTKLFGIFSLSMLLGVLTAAGSVTISSGKASAETLAISATGMVRRCPCNMGDPDDVAEEKNGVVINKLNPGRYFVPVVFPVTSGQKICSLSLVYDDSNGAENTLIKLLRKKYATGGNPFQKPTLIATVSSTGFTDKIGIATTTAISNPKIDANDGFYYLEVDTVNVNLNIIGFKIDYKPNC